jgi:D-serine deaminase-like pyridoxal phosphate-dependent protein
MENWYQIENSSVLSTPALLVYPDRIEENIRRMIRIAGHVDNLRPHVKTHKMAEVMKLQLKYGVRKFKASTIAEAEMAADCGAADIMLAMQPVGTNITRFFQLQDHFKNTRFSAIVDSFYTIDQISQVAFIQHRTTDIWLDINNGMNRTGVIPGKEALGLFHKIKNTAFLNFRGLQVYDGHIHEPDLELRRERCKKDFAPVQSLINQIHGFGYENMVIVAGGTPTFPIHAGSKNTETSPGTCLLWDAGYAEKYRDLDFLHAALLLTRVVSKPDRDLLCLDLGHKSIAAEMSHPRVKLMDINVKQFINHSEEHLVIETDDASTYLPGDEIYGIPWHICPTVPRYPVAYVIRDGKIEGEWKIDARDRMISI